MSGDSGDVGWRIVRDGEVVDENTATGQFASVSCSKFGWTTHETTAPEEPGAVGFT